MWVSYDGERIVSTTKRSKGGMEDLVRFSRRFCFNAKDYSELAKLDLKTEKVVANGQPLPVENPHEWRGFRTDQTCFIVVEGQNGLFRLSTGPIVGTPTSRPR